MKRKKTLLGLLILLVVGGVATNARAAIDIFMQIAGVAGESMDTTHQGWNDVLSFSQSVTKDPSLPPNFADIKVTKRLDKSSPIMDLNLNKGSLIPSILLEFRKAGATPVVFYSIKLENVTVSRISSDANVTDSESIIENMSVKFTKITWTYWPVDSSGRRGTPVISAWDLDTGKGS